jgi:hypothetical protein
MGYFDDATSASFKTGQDGRKVFFPWGTLGRGYIIASDADYERLRRQVKACTIWTVLLAVISASALILWGFLVFLLFIVLVFLPFAVLSLGWMTRHLRRLEPSQERLTYKESKATQAAVLPPWLLWVGVIVPLGALVCFMFLLGPRPDSWVITLAAIISCAFAAASSACVLFMRWRAGTDRGPDRTPGRMDTL